MSKKISDLAEATSLPTDALLPVVVAGNSRRTTVATLQAEVASTVADGLGAYESKADAEADVASIAADAFVQVLLDEGRNDHRTIYQKSGGVLVFKKDLSLGSVFYPEEFGATCYATRTLAIAGTLSTAAFSALFDAWYAAGGGTIWLSGWYAVDEAFQLDNTSDATTIGTQPPLKFDGIGGNGTYARPEGGAGIVWTAETGTAVAKLTTLGRGLLVLDNCTFASEPLSGNVKPFIHTTNTTIKTGGGFAFDGSVYGASADEDGFILGGQTAHEADAGFDRRSSDCGFQGYGTVIDRVYCNGIRRLAVLQRYANAIRITNNTIWNTCGNDSATGGAIEVDGAPISPSSYATGAVISGNLIEVNHYKYGIHLKNAAQFYLPGNDVYDATSMTVAAVFVDTSCQNIRVIPSLPPSGKPYLADAGGVCLVVGSESSQYDVLNSLKAGKGGYPNLFGPTTFNSPAGSASNIIQPSAYTGNDATRVFMIYRAADAPSKAGERVFVLRQDGGFELPLMLPTHTVANLPAASLWPQGLVRVSNGDAGNPCLAISNGSSWLRIPLGAAVSAT